MKYIFKVLAILLFFLQINYAYSDGSKDLYPKGVRGGRAYMESMTYSGGALTHPFYNNARHFAYLKKEETLAVASSAQGIRGGTIRVISPSGQIFSSGSDAIGRIFGTSGMSNRQAELAGPRVGYQPYEVAADEEGIYIIEFMTPDTYANNNAIPNVFADEDWTQPINQNLIAAWDVSVRNREDTEWVSGRVYVNVLNLHMNGGNMADVNRSYFGVNYVLTKDGYYYKVDGNGSIGLKFTYFVNNSGFLTENNTPSYKSSDRGYNARIHNPNSEDVANEFVTHKIFYNLPNLDLPQNSHSSDGSTWLLNEVQIPKVNNIQIGSSEGTEKNINAKGTIISFETNYAGRYKVIVKSAEVGFKQWETIVQGQLGVNSFVWPGLDGNGNLIPQGNYSIQIGISSIEGEVHFPYFDMETNPNGILLQRVNRENGSLEPAIIYWDDSEIPRGNIQAEHANPIVNLDGIPSDINGHRWGTYNLTTGGNVNNNLFTGSNSFGNNMAMDTWSYAVQVEESEEKNIIVEIADLEVVSVTADKDTIELNEKVTYTIHIKNNGPSDVIKGKFEYLLPEGFTIEMVDFNGSDCAASKNRRINRNVFDVDLDIRNGCEAVFTVRAFASNVPDATYGVVTAEAGIMRPKGYTDPDATSNDIAALEPKSAREECSPSGCNNIKVNRDVFLLEPLNERGQIAVKKTAKHIDQNKSGFQEEGEIIEYTFTIRNIGEVNVKNLFIIDTLISRDTVFVRDITLSKNQEHQVTLPYTINHNDVNRGLVNNRALIIGKNPRNFDVKDISGTSFDNNDITRIDIDKRPKFQLKKTVSNIGTGENGQFTLGDIVNYKFEILHEGDVAVSDIELIDSLLFRIPRAINSGQIKNQVINSQFEYLVSMQDIQRGYVENSAIIRGRDVKYSNVLIEVSGNTFDDDDKTITQVAKPPVAIPDYIEIYQSQILEIPILGNDREGSSKWDKGRIEIIETPLLGRLDVNGLKVVYRQHNNFQSGEDFFTYRIHDNSRLSSQVVRVDIVILKTKPIAVDDYYVQHYNTGIKLFPSKNDYVEFSQLDLESISIVNQSLNGTLTYLGNGEFSYESNKTFSGIDEFSYRIMDMNGNWSEPATVKIEISGILIPNVITPNGDGLNDIFKIIGLYQFEKVEIQIFDRFKNMIYENPNYQNNWDVSSTVRDGTYFYSLRLYKKGEKPIVKKGSVLITREMLN